MPDPPDLLNQFDNDTLAAIVNDFTAHSQHRRDMERQALEASAILARSPSFDVDSTVQRLSLFSYLR